MVICVRHDLNMRKGKIGAMCGHASMAFLTRQLSNNANLSRESGQLTTGEVTLSDVELEWLHKSFAKIVVYVNSEQELLDLIAKGKEAGIVVHEVIDSGATEFHGVPTLTCAAFGPDKAEKLDAITGKLPLL